MTSNVSDRDVNLDDRMSDEDNELMKKYLQEGILPPSLFLNEKDHLDKETTPGNIVDYIRRIKVSRVNTALMINDIRFLQSVDIEDIPVNLRKTVNEQISIKNKIDEMMASIRNGVEVSQNDDLEFARKNMDEAFAQIVQRSYRRQKIDTKARELISRHSNLDDIWQFWFEGHLNIPWDKMMNMIAESVAEEFSNRMNSLSDLELIDVWCNPLSHSESMNEKKTKRLENAKRNFGLVTRLKWVQRYRRGNHVADSISKVATKTDLFYGI